jgi:hypothetical protein
MISNYLDSKGRNLNRRTEPPFPKQQRPEPSKRDYRRGVWRRYFLASDNGTGTVYEVDKSTYQSFSGSSYYVRFTINWLLTGPKRDVFNDSGYPVRSGVEDTNQRTLDEFSEKYPAILNLIPGPLQFYQDGDS